MKKLYVPPLMHQRIIRSCHSAYPIGHVGQKKTVSLINRIMNWLNLYNDVAQFILTCVICQRSRVGKEKLQGLIKVFKVFYNDRLILKMGRSSSGA